MEALGLGLMASLNRTHTVASLSCQTALTMVKLRELSEIVGIDLGASLEKWKGKDVRLNHGQRWNHQK